MEACASWLTPRTMLTKPTSSRITPIRIPRARGGAASIRQRGRGAPQGSTPAEIVQARGSDGPRGNAGVDRFVPVAVLGHAAAHDGAVQLAHLRCDRPHGPVPDRPMIDPCNGRDLRRRAGQGKLVANVDLAAMDAALEHAHPELFLRQRHHRPADRKSTRLNSSHSQISYA